MYERDALQLAAPEDLYPLIRVSLTILEASPNFQLSFQIADDSRSPHEVNTAPSERSRPRGGRYACW
jgi:hypothetical protein